MGKSIWKRKGLFTPPLPVHVFSPASSAQVWADLENLFGFKWFRKTCFTCSYIIGHLQRREAWQRADEFFSSAAYPSRLGSPRPSFSWALSKPSLFSSCLCSFTSSRKPGDPLLVRRSSGLPLRSSVIWLCSPQPE